MPRRLAGLILILWAALLTGGTAAFAAPKAADLVQAELLAEPSSVTPGKPFTVGIRLRMKERWHTYWRNPGDSGLGTEVAWTLPAGATAGEIVWPVPHRIPVSHLVNYGYEGETVLLTEITPPAGLPAGGRLEIGAAVSYLVCERECIPGEAKLSLALPVAAGPSSPRPDPAMMAVFTAARAEVPGPSPWPARFETGASTIRLLVEAPGLKPENVRSAYLFPFDETAIEHAAPQAVSIDAGGLALELKRSSLSTEAPKSFGGVLVIEEALERGVSRQAFEVGTRPAGSGGAAVAAAASPGRAPAPEMTLPAIAGAALLALLGGLILNLMPCVFPVLSIKVMSLVRHAGEDRRAIRLGGLAYAAGVIASFLALAAVLLAIRAGGAEIGWGYQLQSPAVIAALAFLMLALGLSLSGVAEFGTSLAGIGGRVGGGSGLGGSFLTGVLATIVATPCTAPFMGAAIGFAVAAPPAVALLVFGALGLGLALPFLILAFVPRLAARLPRPGPWMVTLKQLLAFPLYATVAWLVFVLSQQVGPAGLFAALIGLVLVGFAVWSFGQSAGREGWPKRLPQAGAAIAAAALLFIGAGIARDVGAPAPGTVTAQAAATDWEPFTQARLDALRSEGRPVFVNMTAAWCITCLVNERVALSGAAVKDAFRARRIVYLKGDWTNRNPEITRFLESHGRSGVPLYVLYPERGEPAVLPQILTEAGVLEQLVAAGTTRRAEAPSSTRKE